MVRIDVCVILNWIRVKGKDNEIDKKFKLEDERFRQKVAAFGARIWRYSMAPKRRKKDKFPKKIRASSVGN
jgi:hypothetical protein